MITLLAPKNHASCVAGHNTLVSWPGSGCRYVNWHDIKLWNHPAFGPPLSSRTSSSQRTLEWLVLLCRYSVFRSIPHAPILGSCPSASTARVPLPDWRSH